MSSAVCTVSNLLFQLIVQFCFDSLSASKSANLYYFATRVVLLAAIVCYYTFYKTSSSVWYRKMKITELGKNN
jgi:hypothetical protein